MKNDKPLMIFSGNSNMQLAKKVASLTGADINYLPNPRNEAVENDLIVDNKCFIELGLNPTTLDNGLLEEVVDQTKGKHLHIDLIYYGKPIKDKFKIKKGWILVDKKSLLNRKEFLTPENNFKAPPQDVILLGLDAISQLEINVS